MEKQIGIVGLGKMGGNIARRLVKKGWTVVGYNRTTTVTDEIAKEGVTPAYTFEELSSKLTSKPKVVLLVLPSGQPTDDILFGEGNIVEHLSEGDIIIDGANSFYKKTLERNEKLTQKGIKFIDAGISGGPGGALNGACLMVGGTQEMFEYLKPLFDDMARVGDATHAMERAVMHFEGIGAGHFVKMVHNGIEYGMMQSIAEGFNLLNESQFGLDLKKVTDIYMNGSVVESRLVSWLAQAFEKYGNDLGQISGAVGFNGEGEWTANVGEEMGVPVVSIREAVEFRKKSQDNPSFTGKVLTGMRNSFGGHSIEKGKMT